MLHERETTEHANKRIIELRQKIEALEGTIASGHKANGLTPDGREVSIEFDGLNFRGKSWLEVVEKIGVVLNDTRKDLRNRYPKHAWPEDPLTAKAEARGGRRRVD